MSEMSYIGAVEAAGANVIRYQYFGAYQGTILAQVEYDGNNGYIEISYGTCSYCDPYQAFEEDLGWDHTPTTEELSNFGRNYLEDLSTRDEILEKYTAMAKWDIDAEDVIKWLFDEIDPARTELSRQKSLEKALNRKVAYDE